MSPSTDGFFPLKDEASVNLVSNQQLALKSLILANSASLKELSFSGSFLSGSIGSIISGERGGSCCFDEWENEDDDDDDLCYLSQQDDGAPDLVDSDDSESESCSISFSPGVQKTLRSSKETWQAIRDGRITVTACSRCKVELHCIEDAEFVVCPDCRVASQVEQTIAGILLDSDSPDGTTCNGVGLGVKAKDVIQWLEDNP
jgi:hypothetical protein